MKLENTTIISALVWIAGVLAEVIFHDELTSSMLGIVLSIVLAFIVIITTYFVIDGVNSVLRRERAEAEERQREYQDKMFNLLEEKLTEQLKFEKAIYACVKSVKDTDEGDASLQDVIQAVNDNTIQAAKIIAKYQTKTSNDIENVLRDIKEEFPKLYSEIREKTFTVPDGMISHATAIDMLKGADRDNNTANEAEKTPVSEDSFASEETLFNEATETSDDTGLEESILEDVAEDVEETTAVEENIEESTEEAMAIEEPEEEETTSDPNAMMTPEEIAKLIAAQSESEEEPVEEPMAIEEPEEEEPVEEPLAIEEPEEEEEPAADPNAMMTPEEIEKLIAAQSESEEEPAEEPMAIEEPEEEEEPAADPNAMMSQDDIAALLASMNN
ncbi:MAG: hypothetical protein MR384_03480 [Lachnospiraceae bacterium]|nr:hypothetical protein [Lachnospiraceae bacterium]